ncbi:MAG TPA: septum formation initiator family protein [Candidatus Paceibacterota bacterium]|nr:septum formation initiator family protein [Candidatus Paceibacterota bacterium]
MVKILQSKIVVGLLIVLIGWLVISDLSIREKREQVQSEIRDIQAQIRRLTAENDFLGHLQDYFKSDSFLEQQARLKLNFKNADENVVFVYPSSTSAQNTKPSAENSNLANYQKWWYYIMSK